MIRSGHRALVVSHHSDIVRQRVLGRPATALQSELYRRARVIIAATPRHIKYSKTLTRYADKCHVVHYPIEMGRFEGEHDGSDHLLPAHWAGLRFGLFVGRLVYYKGVEVLLNALALSPKLHCAIVGEGPLESGLKRLANQLGVQERMVFLGDVSAQQLVGLYKQAAFLVLPSVEPSEAFGMVQLEAMSSGRLVVSTDLRSGVPYVNQHRPTGLIVQPGNPAELAEAMLELVENEKLADEFGRAGQRRVKAEFDASPVVIRLMEVYEEMLRVATRQR